MKLKWLFVASCTIISLCINQAKAEFTVDLFKEIQGNPTQTNQMMLKVVINGVYDGIQTTTVSYNSNGAAQLYCPPDGKIFTEDELINAVKLELMLADGLYLPNDTLAFVLLHSLEKIYPCSKGK